MNSPSQTHAYVTSAAGGCLSHLSITDRETKRLTATTQSGGIRERIRGFSRSSRRRLLRCMASINRPVFRAYKGRLIFITLTYPHKYPENPKVCKRHLKALRKRLTRRYGEFFGFWRLGVQKRGAWHFHLLLFMPRSAWNSLEELRCFAASAWYEVLGEVSEGHLLAGTRVEEIRTWRSATSYAERYVAKPEAFPEGVDTGRVWGKWNEKLLPVRWETVGISLKDAYRIRRVYRRLAGMRGSGPLCRLTVFIMHENVLRLLAFLGYPPP